MRLFRSLVIAFAAVSLLTAAGPSLALGVPSAVKKAAVKRCTQKELDFLVNRSNGEQSAIAAYQRDSEAPQDILDAIADGAFYLSDDSRNIEEPPVPGQPVGRIIQDPEAFEHNLADSLKEYVRTVRPRIGDNVVDTFAAEMVKEGKTSAESGDHGYRTISSATAVNVAADLVGAGAMTDAEAGRLLAALARNTSLHRKNFKSQLAKYLKAINRGLAQVESLERDIAACEAYLKSQALCVKSPCGGTTTTTTRVPTTTTRTSPSSSTTTTSAATTTTTTTTTTAPTTTSTTIAPTLVIVSPGLPQPVLTTPTTAPASTTTTSTAAPSTTLPPPSGSLIRVRFSVFPRNAATVFVTNAAGNPVAGSPVSIVGSDEPVLTFPAGTVTITAQSPDTVLAVAVRGRGGSNVNCVNPANVTLPAAVSSGSSEYLVQIALQGATVPSTQSCSATPIAPPTS